MSKDKNRAVVAEVIDEYNIVINRGANSGVKLGDRYQIYYLSNEDIIDPETNESLGKLEHIVGTGKVINVQTSMSTLESCLYSKRESRTKVVKPYSAIFNFAGETSETIIEPPEREAFDNPEKGQLARFIDKQ